MRIKCVDFYGPCDSSFFELNEKEELAFYQRVSDNEELAYDYAFLEKAMSAIFGQDVDVHQIDSDEDQTSICMGLKRSNKLIYYIREAGSDERTIEDHGPYDEYRKWIAGA